MNEESDDQNWDAWIYREMYQAVRAAIDFDYLQHRSPSGDTLANIVRTYVAEVFLDELLIQRDSVSRLRRQLQDGSPILLVGTNGCGKTATLIALNQELKKERRERQHGDAGATHHLVIFNGNKNAGQLSSRATVEEKKIFILTRLARALERRILKTSGNELSLSWQHYLTRNASEFVGFCTSHWPAAAEDSIDRVRNFDRRIADAWHRSYERWEQKSILDRLKVIVDYAASEGLHLSVVIDNCDYLSNDDLKAAGAAARDIQSLVNYPIASIISVRPYTAERALDEMNVLNPSWTYVSAADRNVEELIEPKQRAGQRWIPSRARVVRDLEYTRDILLNRIGVFREPVLKQRMLALVASQSLSADARANAQVNSAIENLGTRFQEAAIGLCEEYFDFQGRTGGSTESKDLTRVFAMWHNGSVRELSASLLAFLVRQRSKDLFGSSADLLGTSDQHLAFSEPGDVTNRTTLFRHVFFHGTTDDKSGQLFPELHSACQVFSTIPRSNRAGIDFPRLRTLQYLYNWRRNEEMCQFGRALQNFTLVFGMDEDEFRKVVLSLSTRDSLGSGLIRIDKMRFDSGGAPRSQTLTSSSELEILPAGAILTTRLSFVVELHFWALLADEPARVRVAKHLDMSVKALADPSFVHNATDRVRAAICYLGFPVLDRMAGMHKFLLTADAFDDEDVAALNSFSGLLGFSKDDWYLSRCLDQYESYVSGGLETLQADAPVAQALERLNWAVGRLNSLSELADSTF